MNKKAQTTKIFVYLLSIIMILFVGFLVVQFIGSFMGDASQAQETKIFNQLKEDYESVYRSFGSEKVYTYKVGSRVNEVCFVQKESCIETLTLTDEKKEALLQVSQANDNVVVFDEHGIVSSQNVAEFLIEEGCFCVQPKQGYFDLIFENKNNDVFIQEE